MAAHAGSGKIKGRRAEYRVAYHPRGTRVKPAWSCCMNKSELVEALAEKMDTTKTEAQEIIDAVFDTKDGVIATTLVSGERVQITGFGTFETRMRKARTGRNPRTGEEIKIGPTISPSFRPGKALKEAVRK